MSRCGCGGTVQVAAAFVDSDCVEVTGAGTEENPFVINPIIDPDPANPLSCGVNGLTSAQEAAVVNPPRGFATRVAAQSIPHNVFTAVSFNVADRYDTDSMHDPVGSPNIFLANTAGVYHVDAALTFANNATGVRGLAVIKVGGTTFGNDSENGPSSTVDTDLDASGDIELAVGEYFEVYVIQTSGAPLNLVKARCTWHYVGPTP